MLSEAEKSQIFGNMLAKSRNDAGKTQRYMAQALHKSVNTIQNWEAGISEPGYRTLEKWFDTLGLNMDSYILEYKYKDFNMTIDKSDLGTVKKCITMYINTQFSERDFLQLAYCMFGNTGSSWHEQLNMLTAHNHCTMKSRVNVCRLVLDNYLMEHERGELVGTGQIAPDISSLSAALERGKTAASGKQNGYTMVGTTKRK